MKFGLTVTIRAHATCYVSSNQRTELKQRTFPAKIFPERCYDSDVWYPKCDGLLPHVLPPIPYYSTTSYLPSPNLVL